MSVVAMITYIERKTLALLQLRKGPSVAGPLGLFQPIADCIKLLCKQILWPEGVSKIVFILPPFISVASTLLIILFIPLPYFGAIISCKYSVIFVVCLSLFASFGECLPGLVINSKYAQYGSYRAIIQTLSYELCLTLCLINIFIMADSFDFESIMSSQSKIWYIVPLFHVFCIYVLSSLAAGNRTPFDILEAEQELIAGYHTEYSGVLFCMFYITEYTNILLSSLLISMLFLGGWQISLFGFIELTLKTSIVMMFIIVTRAVLPRYRFNDIIKLFWGIFIPVLIASIILVYGFM